MRKLSETGCLELLGAVIRQAVIDASTNPQNIKTNSRNRKEKEAIRKEATNFLFSPGRLENFIKKFHVESLLNLEYIRRKAQSIIESSNNPELSERTEHELA